jgi:high-affinity iron transporter
MWQVFVIALREGLEAFLIVAIALAYLRRTGRAALSPAVYWGTAVAVAASAAAVVAFREAVQTPFWEGVLAFAAALMVATMVLYMLRAARHMRQEIAGRIDDAAQRPGMAAWASVFAFTLLMIAREGMETALLIASLMSQVEAMRMVSGALFGTAAAAALAWAWVRWGQRVNLAMFFQVTSIFLALFIVQLALYGFHEFTEAGALPLDNAYWHVATEAWSPDGEYGEWLSYALLILPLAWLAFGIVRGRSRPAAVRPRPEPNRA